MEVMLKGNEWCTCIHVSVSFLFCHYLSKAKTLSITISHLKRFSKLNCNKTIQQSSYAICVTPHHKKGTD